MLILKPILAELRRPTPQIPLGLTDIAPVTINQENIKRLQARERCDLQSKMFSKQVTQDGSSAFKVTIFPFFQQSTCVSKVTPKSAKTKEVVLR